jgi:carbon monoxide dehydrogenase subunit G
MELKDDIIIHAPQDVVYAALNDVDILKQCIPGCEELVKHSDTELEAKVVLKVGPVKAKFSGNVTLSPDAPPGSVFACGGRQWRRGRLCQRGGRSAIRSPPGRHAAALHRQG